MQGSRGTGTAIRALREAAGLSRHETVSVAGVGYRYLVEAENGDRAPTPKWVAHLMEALGEHIAAQEDRAA